MEMKRGVAALAALIMACGWSPGRAQTPSPELEPEPSRPAVAYAPRDNTLEVWACMGTPLSHQSFKEFWQPGPGIGIGLMSRMSENIKIGFGVDGTLYSFRRGAFAARYPGVPVTVRHQTLVQLYLLMRNYFLPGQRFSPFLGADLGFARISGAENKEVINGVRKTYYEIPGTTRLTLSGNAGADYFFTREFAIQADVRAVYLHNDPNVGLFLYFRFGVKFKL
ncbi:MAG: hypothetical protein H6Q31_2901 [Bacteroidetes bacterium]|nr:hypothetical protein [Bacteroidota bacterium]